MPKIIINIDDAQDLKDNIFNAVDNGELPTWQFQGSKNKIDYLTHTGQWADRALLNFVVYNDKLEILATKWSNYNEDEAAKNYYIGRFTEMLLIHFSSYFEDFLVCK